MSGCPSIIINQEPTDRDPIVIGRTSDDVVTSGSTFARSVIWTDKAGDPLDLSTAGLSIVDPNPRSIGDAGTITITDAENGESTLTIPASVIADLPIGRIANFRLRAAFATGLKFASRRVFLEIK